MELKGYPIRTDTSLFPWHERISNYPLPDYLKGIVSETDGQIDPEALQRRITDLKPHVNV